MTETVTPLRRAAVESPLERIRRLETEARSAAQDERRQLVERLLEDAGRCIELAKVQSLSAGERDALQKLGAAIESGVQTIQGINARTG